MMVVIDEKSRVPPLDEVALGRLSHALDHKGVVAAMLIGSQARGNPGPLSDIDVAVWHDPDLDSRGRFDLQLSLVGDAGRALGTEEIDLVMLNHTPPLMRHRAIREGKRLVERDHDERVRLETRAILDYLDTAPLRAELGRGVRRRIGEGRLVDAEQVENRLERLEAMLERLEEIRNAGEEAYLADAQQRLATERLLQLSIQICIDLAAQVVSEQSAPPPSSYSDVFKILGDKDVISAEIAERLGNAARQRNLLVHLYMEIDDRAVFASLALLDDLREFATIVGRLAEAEHPTD